MRPDVRRARLGSTLERTLDGALDGSVLALAVWTLWYEFALWARLSLWVPAAIWLVVAAGLVGLGVARALRSGRAAPEEPAGPLPAQAPSPLRPWMIPATVLLVGAVALRSTTGLLPTVLVSLAILSVGLVERLRSEASTGVVARPAPGLGAHAVALGVSAGLALLGSFLLRPSPDDAFYTNRAAWVAEHGVPALRDTMFGPETFPSTYGGGLPLTSVESLMGALAHLAHVRAGTIVYVVAVPVAAFLAGWATWRLVRAWAPGRPVLVLLGAVAFMLLSGDNVVGNWSVTRLGQGKVMAYCVLLPLIWSYLAVLAERRSRWSLVLLLAAGVAFVGLSSTASIQAIMIGGAALVAALVLRSRPLALGAVALMLAPLVSGVVVALGPDGVGGPHPVAPPPLSAFARVFGNHTPMLLLVVVGLVLGVLLAPGRQAVLAAAGSLAAVAVLVPGVLVVFNAATSGGPVAWRLLLGPPVWVLVGLLLTVLVPASWPRGSARSLVAPAAGALGAVLVVALLLTGTPIWSGALHARFSAPGWKVDQRALRDVSAVAPLRTGPGPWLLPPSAMQVLAEYTTRHSAVVPRTFFLSGLQEDDSARRDRLLLTQFAAGHGGHLTTGQIRSALTRLHVSLVCVERRERLVVQRLAALHLGGERLRAGSLTCRRAAG